MHMSLQCNLLFRVSIPCVGPDIRFFGSDPDANTVDSRILWSTIKRHSRIAAISKNIARLILNKNLFTMATPN